jgi:benzoate membrane transport protein
MVAVLVGFGGSVAIILADATAVDAGAAETLSWVSALCFATAVTTAVPSVRHRMPIIMARSTPGAALIDEPDVERHRGRLHAGPRLL